MSYFFVVNDPTHIPCYHLVGVGKRIADKLAKLNIYSVQDILLHFPLRYQDRTRICPISTISINDHAVIEGEIVSAVVPNTGRSRFICEITDGTGSIELRFFHIDAFQRNQLHVGARVRCFGEVRRGFPRMEMVHPEYHVLHADTVIPVEDHLTPIYPTTEGLGQYTWRKITDQALHMLKHDGILNDILPASILKNFTFPNLQEALSFVHRPPVHAPVNLLIEGKHVSQKRLVFEELLAHRLSLSNLKKSFQQQEAVSFKKNEGLIQRFLNSLDFKLTNAQEKVIKEIQQDLIKPHPMLRLVQGDVGSGKTVVAACAILQAIENNTQAAMLAPTELLVEQHFKTFRDWFEPLGIHVAMLTSQMKVKERRVVIEELKEGRAQLVLGTHAIFQKEIAFANLALIVIDEQHRFGVRQRALLREKGAHGSFYPHQLIMTATPIPRTLAMSLYADLDCSVINELPPGRTPINTVAIPNSRRDEVLERIRKACEAGRQVYWVCTLIEESDVLQRQAAEQTAKELSAAFKNMTVGLIHGRMKPVEKEYHMTSFQRAHVQLLVATTVIEVGVDVPNASLMVIENAERLGLAQLHQLRGRVGRGKVESHCVLMYQAPLSQAAKNRLAIMRETTDGFKIAERDLEIRGPGEVLGTRQTGDLNLRIANIIRDSDLLPLVQEAASLLETHHPETVEMLTKRWMGSRQKFGHV